MYSALLDGMSETGVIDKVDQYLVRAQEAKARKRMDLHSEWTEKVFNPIQTQVQDSVARRSAPDIEARLRSQYNEYLKVCCCGFLCPILHSHTIHEFFCYHCQTLRMSNGCAQASEDL